VPRRYAIFVVFAVAYFLSYFYRSANAVIADDLTRELLLTPAQLGLMTSLFFAVFAAVQLPLGSALDRFGPRWTTPALMLVGAVGSLLFALAHSFEVLALARALIGLGMAGVLMGALKAFSGWFPPERFATVSGLFLAIGASGALGAATPLALLSSTYGWRTIFAWGALVVVLSAVAIVLFGRNAPRPVLEHNVEEGGFGAIFREVRFWRVAFLCLAVTGSMFAYQGLWAGPYLKEALGRSELEVGNLLLLMSGGVVVGYLASGWLADRWGLGRTLVMGAGTMAVVQAVLAAGQPGWSNGLMGALFALFGFLGAFNVLFFAQVRAIFPLHLTGRAVTAVNLFGIGGSALLQWWLGVLIERFPAGDPKAFTAIWLFTAGLSLAALLFYLPLAKQGPTPRSRVV
jgi:predicted MFS family arabinose efflux permease